MSGGFQSFLGTRYEISGKPHVLMVAKSAFVFTWLLLQLLGPMAADVNDFLRAEAG